MYVCKKKLFYICLCAKFSTGDCCWCCTFLGIGMRVLWIEVVTVVCSTCIAVLYILGLSHREHINMAWTL